MCFKMDTSQLLYIIITFGIASTTTTVCACPVDCACRNSWIGLNIICSPGQIGWPRGFTGIVSSLSLSGLPSKHNILYHHIWQANLGALVNLTRLVITYSEVTAIDDEAFVGLNNLTYLSLAYNELRSLNENTFRGISNLKILDLSGNQNCQFNKTVFSPVNDIEELNLGDMNITILPVDIFSELYNLKVLKLYSNRLTTITSEILEPLVFLESLDLGENLFRGLPHTLKPMLNRLRGLHLSDNPWECTCQLYWFHELKREFLINAINGGEVVCHGPDTIKYTAFVNVPFHDFHPRPPKVIRCDSNRYKVALRHKLVVSCEYEGCPEPDVKWIQPGGKEFVYTVSTDGEHFVLGNGTLIIIGVSMADIGQWFLIVSSGSAYDMAHVTVEVVTTITDSLSTSSAVTPSVKTIGKSTMSSIFASHLKHETELPTLSSPKSNLSSAFTSTIPTSVTRDLTMRTAKLLTLINPPTKTSFSTPRLVSLPAPQSIFSTQSRSSALPTSTAPPATRWTTPSTKVSTKTSSSTTKLSSAATHSTFSSASTSSAVPNKRYVGLILLDLISLD